PCAPLFPYTTLFRSIRDGRAGRLLESAASPRRWTDQLERRLGRRAARADDRSRGRQRLDGAEKPDRGVRERRADDPGNPGDAAAAAAGRLYGGRRGRRAGVQLPLARGQPVVRVQADEHYPRLDGGLADQSLRAARDG